MTGIQKFGPGTLRSALLGLALGLLAFGAEAKPNIILVLVDDMAAFETDYMPRFQTSMRLQGITFNRGFVTTPNCCPSRASILRGQYAHNHTIYNNSYPEGSFKKFYELGLEANALPVWMQAAGYRTGLAGKYLNGYGSVGFETYVPPGWDEWFGLTLGVGYSNFSLVENGVEVTYRSPDYQTDVLAAKAVDFIRRFTSDARPFFFYFAPIAPHSPWEPAARHAGYYAGLTAPRPPAFNEADVSDKPTYVSNMPLLTSAAIDIIDSNFRKRMETLLAVDEAIDAIIGALIEVGQLDKTYIVFMSDNGWNSGEHRFKGGKGAPYDEAIRVPFVVRGPGVPANSTRDEIVLGIDLAPTFVDLALGNKSSILDGRSMLPLLFGGTSPKWRTRFLTEFWDTGNPLVTVPNYFALRSTDYMYADYYAVGEKELYNMVTDASQLYNFHSVADPAVLSTLASQLTALTTCAASGCRTADR